MRIDFLIPVLNADIDVPFFLGIGEHLRAAGATVAFVTNSRGVHTELKSRGGVSFYLYDVAHEGPVDELEQKRTEERYHLSSLEDHIYTEAAYDWGRPSDVLRHRAVHTFRWLERFLEENSVGAFVNVIGGELIRRSMARITELGGPKNIVIDFVPLHGRIALTTNEQGRLDLPNPPHELTTEQRALASALVAEITREKRLFIGASDLGLSPRNFMGAARSLGRAARGDSVDVNNARLVYGRMQRVARRILGRPLYQPVVPNEPYIFFPLHLINDSVITIRAPQFERQDVLIEHITKHCIPVGHSLYVKPHIGARDSYPIDFLAKLRRIPRVRLVDPTLNSHELIRNASACVVINSTVGFESLMWRKPVVVVGRPFYKGFGLTKDVENLTDLGGAIHEAMNWAPDPELTLRFVYALYAHTYPGVYGNSSPENTRNVAEAIRHRSAELGPSVTCEAEVVSS